MQKINVLESRVFNRIAAGEVVERPASIVKELVENSIDAGAKNITVEITGGGIKNIKVSDNGCGIYFDDLKRAFLPHATSKIKDVDDLDGIETLGFRGEALASIGSVAEVTMISKTQDSDAGGKIEISGGNISELTIIGSADGTYISVDNLFFNTPARAKFLKKPKTEETEITNLITRFILANPTVAIRYLVEGKQVFLSTGAGSQSALVAVYGRGIIDQMLPLEFDFGSIKISGFICKPNFSKPNKSYQTLIINGRYVVNSTVAAAVHNAYSDFLMKRQFPFYVLYLDMDFGAVDVNVHPNKLDVRFENSGFIYSKIFEAINRTIYNIDQIVNVKTKPIMSGITPANPVIEHRDEVRIGHNDELRIEHNDELRIEHKDEVRIGYNEKPNLQNNLTSANETTLPKQEYSQIEIDNNIFSAASSLSAGNSEFRDSFVAGSKLFKTLDEELGSKETGIDALNPPRLVGELFKTYLIVEYQNNMVLVDQHAAHERLLYDRYLSEIENKKLASQQLLVPFVLNLNHLEFDFLGSQVDTLQEIGFELEPFGNLTFKVSSVPFVFADINLKKFFDLVLSDIKNAKSYSKTDLVKDQVAQHACKAAVKGGDLLTQSEIFSLFADLGKEKVALTCPHGRPIVIRIDKQEVDKWFKRIV